MVHGWCQICENDETISLSERTEENSFGKLMCAAIWWKSFLQKGCHLPGLIKGW
jgi:hypothetical protein